MRPGLTVEYAVKSTLDRMGSTTIKYQYLQKTEISGREFVKRVVTMSDHSQHTVYFYRSDEGIVRVPALSSSEESLVLKLPLRVGESWVQKDYMGTRCTKTNKHAETIETVSTPMGNLRCIKVRQRKPAAVNTDEDSFIWVARKYGIVKIEINKKTRNKSIVKTVMTISKFEDLKNPEDKRGGN